MYSGLLTIANCVFRFASFVEGNSWHVTDDELLEYDSGPDPVVEHSNLDNVDEIDFTLNSE